MKNKASNVFTISVCIAALLATLMATSQTAGQSKPAVFSENPKPYANDDTKLCGKPAGLIRDDTYCTLYLKYDENFATYPASAKAYRDRMIDLLKLQIDDFYDAHKSGRTVKTKWFQSFLDVLGIGLALSGNIVGGVRPKTVLAATAGAFQAGRNSVNDRFDLLKQQLLINKMNANRLNQWEAITKKKGLPVSEFGWEAAKAELQQYLFRGTFSDALDSLVDETGAHVDEAKKRVKDREAISETEYKAKQMNFKDYLVPMDALGRKLDANIKSKKEAVDKLTDKDEKDKIEKELAVLIAKKKALIDNYANVWTSLLSGGYYETIEAKIKAEFGDYPAVIDSYNKAIANIRANPPTAGASDYDNVFTKINAVVAADEKLNKSFLDILKANKPTEGEN